MLLVFIVIISILLIVTAYKLYREWVELKRDHTIEPLDKSYLPNSQKNEEANLIEHFIHFVNYLNKKGKLTSEELTLITQKFRDSIKILKEKNISPAIDSDSFLDILLTMLNNEPDKHTTATLHKIIEAFKNIRNFTDHNYHE